MQWVKLGQIYDPKAIHLKLFSHAANPLAVHLNDDIYRIYYSGRDSQKRSSIGFVDVNIIKREISYIHNEPIFEFGEDSSFYSHGVSIGNCYEISGQQYMLFMGWKCHPNNHWYGQIGRLKVNKDLSLTLDDSQPFLSLDSIDDTSLSYPWVTKYKENYLMWYGTTVTWDAGNGEMVHTINFATSRDGNEWQKQGIAIPYEVGIAQAFSRPTILINHTGFHMWFSYRSGTGQKYRIGYAHKGLDEPENAKWKLILENPGIDVSESGWDSEMIEYPYVFEHGEQTYMLYNGNGYGLTGFGLALLQT